MNVQQCQLRLYIAGRQRVSRLALSNARSICDEHLHKHYLLDIVDLERRPEMAWLDQIITIPTQVIVYLSSEGHRLSKRPVWGRPVWVGRDICYSVVLSTRRRVARLF